MQATYRTTYEGPLGRVAVAGPADLARLLAARIPLEFERSSGPSSTVVAMLTWQDDGSVAFEGLTGTHRLTPCGEPGFEARVAAHWEGFVQAQKARNESDRARLGDLAHHRVAYLSPAGGLVEVADPSTLRGLVEGKVDLEFGEAAPPSRLVTVVARLCWAEDGSFALRGRIGVKYHPAGLDAARVVDLWAAYATEAARERLRRISTDRRAA